MMLRLFFSLTLLLIMSSVVRAEGPNKVTLIYENSATEVGARTGSQDLWITLKDLTRATRFVLKPKGICRDELCFPIPKNRADHFLSKQGSTTWFNLSEFARLLKQPVAADEKNAVWYFGKWPDQQMGILSTLEAPNFTLPDSQGRMHSLRDYRGKKVLLITWASW